jgi:outer membrane scaffolding protein for murein synthesis (MipA/OmpV family)
MTRKNWYIGALCLLLAETVCAADENAETANAEDPGALWEWHFAAFGRYGPSYPASKESQFNFVPVPIPVYRGRFLRLFEDSESPIRGRIFNWQRVKLDLDFDFNFPVDSDRIDARQGMPDLDLMLEAGPEIELEFANQKRFEGTWSLALQTRAAASFHGLDPSYRGIAYGVELRYVAHLSERDDFKFRVTPTFASSRYMEYFYGVDSEFATGERSAYEARSGYLGTGVTLNWIRQLTEKLRLVLTARTDLHSGASNRDSPLFTRTTTAGIQAALLYRFWESERRARRAPETASEEQAGSG